MQIKKFRGKSDNFKRNFRTIEKINQLRIGVAGIIKVEVGSVD